MNPSRSSPRRWLLLAGLTATLSWVAVACAEGNEEIGITSTSTPASTETPMSTETEVLTETATPTAPEGSGGEADVTVVMSDIAFDVP